MILDELHSWFHPQRKGLTRGKYYRTINSNLKQKIITEYDFKNEFGYTTHEFGYTSPESSHPSILHKNSRKGVIDYDIEGRIIKESLSSDNSNLHNLSKSGLLVHQPRGYFNETFYKYDTNGNLIETLEKSNDTDNRKSESKSISEYDDIGNEIKSKSYNSNGDLDRVEKYKYDDIGNEIESKSFDSDNNLDEIIKYEYDFNGNLVESKSYNSDGDLNSVSKYKYDSNGKEIESKSYDENGSLFWGENKIYDSFGNIIEWIHGDEIDLFTREKFEYKNNCLIRTKIFGHEQKDIFEDETVNNGKEVLVGEKVFEYIEY